MQNLSAQETDRLSGTPEEGITSLPSRGRAPARRPRRRWLLLLLLVAIAAIAVAAYVYWPRDPLAGLRTARVVQGDLEVTVTALGKIQPARYVDVGAQVSGQLTRIEVAPGDRVAKGDLLAEIDPRVQAAKVEAGRADLARLIAELDAAEAEAAFAAGEFARQQQLRRDNATRADVFAQAERDKRVTEANVDALLARIEQARSTLKADEALLGFTRILAPIAGTVISVDARQGQTINATNSAPLLLRIADLGTMTVRTEVSEADVTRLHAGMRLYFTTLGHGDRRWHASLRQILPAPPRSAKAGGSSSSAGGSGNVVFYEALFDVPNPKGDLRPDMTAQVFFVIGTATDKPLVPMRALRPEEPAAGLYTVETVEDGRIERREVRIGLRDHVSAVVLSGIAAGDTIVIGGRAAQEERRRMRFRL